MINEQDYNSFVSVQTEINTEMDSLFGTAARHDGIYSPKVYFEERRLKIVMVFQEVLPGSDWPPVSDAENTFTINEGNKVAKKILPSLRSIFGILDNKPVEGVGYINIGKTDRGKDDNKNTNPKSLFSRVHQSPNEQKWIFQQLKVMKPQVLICFGTADFLWYDLCYLYRDNKNDSFNHLDAKETPKGHIVKRVGEEMFLFEGKSIEQMEKLFSCWVPCISSISGPQLLVQTYHPSARPIPPGFKLINYLPRAINAWKNGEFDSKN